MQDREVIDFGHCLAIGTVHLDHIYCTVLRTVNLVLVLYAMGTTRDHWLLLVAHPPLFMVEQYESENKLNVYKSLPKSITYINLNLWPQKTCLIFYFPPFKATAFGTPWPACAPTPAIAARRASTTAAQTSWALGTRSPRGRPPPRRRRPPPPKSLTSTPARSVSTYHSIFHWFACTYGICCVAGRCRRWSKAEQMKEIFTKNCMRSCEIS